MCPVNNGERICAQYGFGVCKWVGRWMPASRHMAAEVAKLY